jgi:hypothetical protein
MSKTHVGMPTPPNRQPYVTPGWHFIATFNILLTLLEERIESETGEIHAYGTFCNHTPKSTTPS